MAVTYTELEYITFQNGQPNTIFLLAPAIASAEDYYMQISGDPAIDRVGLDPCLNWTGPEAIESENGEILLWRYFAEDSEGARAQVDVLDGVGVILQPRLSVRIGSKIEADTTPEFYLN